MTTKILSETPWSYAVGADPSRGYHLRYKVVCYDRVLDDVPQQEEQARIRNERSSGAQEPAEAVMKQYGMLLIPPGTYDYVLAQFDRAVVYRELLDSGD